MAKSERPTERTKRVKRVGAFGSLSLVHKHTHAQTHTKSKLGRGKPSIRIAHTSSAKLSIPRKVVSVLWK